jgi:hypothetical protein
VYSALAAVLFASTANSQSLPAATQAMHLSAFGGATGAWTGLAGGRNFSITAGGDLTFRSFHSFYPSLEVRGTYPLANGQIDDQRNILGGLKVERVYNRLHPYGDILYGRGSIHYLNGGFPDPSYTFLYIQSPSNILSAGGGADLNLTRQLALKAEIQFQRYSTPVATSGHIYAKPVTVGVVYRFDFNHKGYRR